MEHLIQMTINVDDKKIVESIERNAEKTITENLDKEVKKSIFNFENDWYGNGRIRGVSDWTEDRLNEFLEKHKDQIINLASDKLADKMYKSKKVREIMTESVKGEK